MSLLRQVTLKISLREVAVIKPKIEILSVIWSNSNFQRLFVSKLKVKSGKWKTKLSPYSEMVKKTDRWENCDPSDQNRFQTCPYVPWNFTFIHLPLYLCLTWPITFPGGDSTSKRKEQWPPVAHQQQPAQHLNGRTIRITSYCKSNFDNTINLSSREYN